MKKFLLLMLSVVIIGPTLAQSRSVPLVPESFSVVYSGPVTEEVDGLKIATVGYRNGNRTFLKDAFNVIGEDIYIKWHLKSNAFIWGGFRIDQTSVGNYSNPVPDAMKNQWVFTRLTVNADYTFEVISCTGNYDDDPGSPGTIVHSNTGTVPESERAILENTTINNIFWDTQDIGAYLMIGEMIVPDNAPAKYYEVNNFDFEDQSIPADLAVSTTGATDFPAGSGSDYALHVVGNESTNDYIEFQADGVDLITFDVKINHSNSKRIRILVNGNNHSEISIYHAGSTSYSPEWCEVTIPVKNSATVRIEFWDYDNQELFLDNIRFHVLNTSPSNLSLDNNAIDENSTAPTIVGTLSADDADNDALTFSIPDNNSTFSIDANTLVADISYDYEIETQSQLEVMVSDGISDPLLQTFTITINDVNEVPVLSTGQVLSFPEESPGSTIVGLVIATDEDAGDNAPVFSIQSGNNDGFFSLNASTGELTLLKSGLNRYDHESFSLLVRATDENDAQLYSEEAIVVNVSEIPFSGGAGTQIDPFQIKTPKDMDEIRNYLGSTHSDKYFGLINDIDLQEYLSVGNPGYNDGAFWEPIALGTESFNGNIDGNNYSVLNLKINRPAEDYVGLFSSMNEASIVDLSIDVEAENRVYGNRTVGILAGHIGLNSHVQGVQVSGKVAGKSEFVGGLCGQLSMSFARDCQSSADVSTDTHDAGGLIGYNTGDVINCSSVGSVTGLEKLGGLIGSNIDDGIMSVGTVSRSFSSASVSILNGVAGGLAGYNTGTISTSYATGSVAGAAEVGGLVGRNAEESIALGLVTGTITNCYSAASVSVSTGTDSGFLGVNEGDVTSSFWDISASGKETSVAGTGLDLIEMRDAASFSGWDFTGTWGIDALDGYVSYPYLLGNEENPHPGSIGKVTVNAWPDASGIVYGQTVGESVLSNGDAVHEGSAVDGTFLFLNGENTPVPGTYEEGLTFLPYDTDNYLPVLDGSTMLNVVQKPISIINAVAADKDYDGTTTAVISGAQLESNVVEGTDEVVLNNHTTGSFEQAPAGTNLSVTTGMTLAGADAHKYIFEQPVLTASIGKVVLTSTADDQQRLYGEANPELTFNYSGFVNNEDASVLEAPVVASTTASTRSDAGEYPITLSGGSAQNYSFSYEPGVLVVNQAPLTVKAKDVERLEGTSNTGFELVYSGFVNGDDQGVLDLQPVAACDADEQSAPGEYDIVVTGGEDNNYYFEYDENTGVLTVTTVTVAPRGKENRVAVYPVPAGSHVFVDAASLVNICKVEVLNMSGSVMDIPSVLTAANSLKLNVRGLKSGVYFVVIQSDQEVITERIVVK